MNDMDRPAVIPDQAAKIAAFLNAFITSGGLDLQFRQSQPPASTDTTDADPKPAELTQAVLEFEFTGADTAILTARNGEVLHAIEYMAARILRLDSDQHELISFDADHFKQNRTRDLERTAAEGVERVRATGQRYAFPPMSSRERRMLHLMLAPSGLPTGSIGENPRRYVVLYPEGQIPPQPNPAESPRSSTPPSPDRTRAIRDTFRRR